MPAIPETLKELAVPIGSVKRLPDGENPRIGDVASMKESISENTQYRPAVVNVREGTRYGDRTILAGNHTHQALEELGETEIAVTYVDVDDEAAWKIVLADNRQGDLGHYDPAALLAAIELAGGTKGTGYDDEFVRATQAAMEPEDPSGMDPGAGRYREQYGVIVICEDEGHQERVYEELRAAGHEVRVVVT